MRRRMIKLIVEQSIINLLFLVYSLIIGFGMMFISSVLRKIRKEKKKVNKMGMPMGFQPMGR
jgi:hypothetical protein